VPSEPEIGMETGLEMNANHVRPLRGEWKRRRPKQQVAPLRRLCFTGVPPIVAINGCCPGSRSQTLTWSQLPSAVCPPHGPGNLSPPRGHDWRVCLNRAGSHHCAPSPGSPQLGRALFPQALKRNVEGPRPGTFSQPSRSCPETAIIFSKPSIWALYLRWQAIGRCSIGFCSASET